MAKHMMKSPDAPKSAPQGQPHTRPQPLGKAQPMAQHPAASHGGRRQAVGADARGPQGAQPSSKRGRRNVLSTVLIVVGVILLLVAGGMFAYQQFNYMRQNQINDDLASHVTITDAADDGDGCPVTVDWAALKAINPDVVGWLYVPDTTINYAVYQGTDNDYYLHHSAEGEWTVGGQLFLDYENTKPGMADGQSIIYGHHLLNGTMFEQIAVLDQQENFDAMGTIWYVTEEKNYSLAPVFMYDTDRDDLDARTLKFASDDELHAFMADRLTRAVTRRNDAEAIVGGASHFLTLSTCVYYSKYEEGHGRGLVVCAPLDEIAAATAAPAA